MCSEPPPCSSTSYFNLFYEAGSGMENHCDPVHLARRAVICKVFEDLSAFIQSPLATSGNKVNIWVRNINNLQLENVNSFLGVASGFYQMAGSPSNGGIVDNEIWKTIHTGVDSYLNTTLPISSSGAGTNQAGMFFHGVVAFNFNLDSNSNPLYSWNLDLSASAIATSSFDLYTAALHEITHALGFASMINENGTSKFNSTYAYFFNRYDTFLKTGNGANDILVNDNTNPMYNYTFNPLLSTDVLHPPVPVDNTCVTDLTVCNKAIRFYNSASSWVPVYTPNCFEPASSISHFEDALYPGCTNPNGDDNYFVLCNAGTSGTVRRHYAPEERDALCRIGYTLNSTYGSTAVAQSYYNFGSSTCPGITVAGVNDGINGDGAYTYLTSVNVPINIPGSAILGNDMNATGFTNVQDLSEVAGLPTTLVNPSGTSATTITFTSAVSGIHVLRYVPVNGAQSGNITYILVNVQADMGDIACNPTQTVCDYVANGDFEENNDYLTQPQNNQFERACGWYNTINSDALYFHSNNVNPIYDVPCNYYGSENDNISGNQGYAGLLLLNWNTVTNDIIGTTLVSSLQPNTEYQLTFDVSKSDFIPHYSSSIRAFITNLLPEEITSTNIPAGTSGILAQAENESLVTESNGWTKLTFHFTTGLNQTDLNRLYIGTFNTTFVYGGMPQAISGCPDNGTVQSQNLTLYYIDNVSLIPRLSISGPETICMGEGNPTYTSTQPGSTWSSSDTSVATVDILTGQVTCQQAGTFTLTNTFVNGACTNTDTLEIIVYDPHLEPEFSFPTIVCQNGVVPTLPNMSDNDIPGTWIPPVVSNTHTADYMFKPSNGCNENFIQTIEVITGGQLVANEDVYYLPTGTTTTPSILLNDLLDGTISATEIAGIVINTSNSTNNNITVNADGTLTLPNNLPTGGFYTINYTIKNSCLMSNETKIKIYIIVPEIEAPGREAMLTCFSQPAYNTTQSILERVRISGFPATATSIQITNVTAPPGFSINPDGTIHIPANAMPGSYGFSYSICPIGITAGCVTVSHQLDIQSTVQAQPDIFYFFEDGSFLGSNNDYSNNNILTNDRYSENCGLGEPNSFGQVILTGVNQNIENLTITDQIDLPASFSINGNGSVISSGQVGIGSYNFTYSICDHFNPFICSESNGIIDVTGYSRIKNPKNETNSIADNIITIIPNPSSGIFTLNFSEYNSGVQVKIINLTGQILKVENISNIKSYNIDLTNYANGIYILLLGYPDHSISKLLIKK